MMNTRTTSGEKETAFTLTYRKDRHYRNYTAQAIGQAFAVHIAETHNLLLEILQKRKKAGNNGGGVQQRAPRVVKRSSPFHGGCCYGLPGFQCAYSRAYPEKFMTGRAAVFGESDFLLSDIDYHGKQAFNPDEGSFNALCPTCEENPAMQKCPGLKNLSAGCSGRSMIAVPEFGACSCQSVCKACLHATVNGANTKCVLCDIRESLAEYRDLKDNQTLLKTEKNGYCLGNVLFKGGCCGASVSTRPNEKSNLGLCSACNQMREKVNRCNSRIDDIKKIKWNSRGDVSKDKADTRVQLCDEVPALKKFSGTNSLTFAADAIPSEYIEWYTVQPKEPNQAGAENSPGKTRMELRSTRRSRDSKKLYSFFIPLVCPRCLRVTTIKDSRPSAIKSNTSMKEFATCVSDIFYDCLYGIEKEAPKDEVHSEIGFLESSHPPNESHTCVGCLKEIYLDIENEESDWTSFGINPDKVEQIWSKRPKKKGDSWTLSSDDLRLLASAFLEKYFVEDFIKERRMVEVDGTEGQSGKKMYCCPPRPLVHPAPNPNNVLGRRAYEGNTFPDRQNIDDWYSWFKSNRKGGNLEPNRKPVRMVFNCARLSDQAHNCKGYPKWISKRLEDNAYFGRKLFAARENQPNCFPGLGKNIIIVPELYIRRGKSSEGLFSDTYGPERCLTDKKSPYPLPTPIDMYLDILKSIERSKNDQDSFIIVIDQPIDIGGTWATMKQFVMAFPQKWHERIHVFFKSAPISDKSFDTVMHQRGAFSMPGSFSIKALKDGLEHGFTTDDYAGILTECAQRSKKKPVSEKFEVERFLISAHTNQLDQTVRGKPQGTETLQRKVHSGKQNAETQKLEQSQLLSQQSSQQLSQHTTLTLSQQQRSPKSERRSSVLSDAKVKRKRPRSSSIDNVDDEKTMVTDEDAESQRDEENFVTDSEKFQDIIDEDATVTRARASEPRVWAHTLTKSDEEVRLTASRVGRLGQDAFTSYQLVKIEKYSRLNRFGDVQEESGEKKEDESGKKKQRRKQ
jgi:hypothetical protein